MKRFSNLSEVDKNKATFAAKSIVIESLICSPELYDEHINEKISSAEKRMKINGTPWFIGEAIYDELHHEVDTMAFAIASCAFYPDDNDVVLNIK